MKIPGVTGKFGLGVQNEAGQRLTEFCQENTLVITNNKTEDDSTYGHHQMVNTKIRLIIFFAAEDGEALYSQQKTRLGADCGSDHEVLIAKSVSSVAQPCLTLCSPMDCSMPGLPVHHHLLEFIQTHVHLVGDAIHYLTLCCPLFPWPSIFPSIRVFSKSQFFTSGGQSIGVSASASVLPMIIQDWFSLGWTGCISLLFKGLSRVFSNSLLQNSDLNWRKQGKPLDHSCMI